ncbi:MAG TPA: glycosyltransferase [Thermoanaerobaculia bacterium]|nr:glycosyltransferase [Thermoanaerobaculia bacterium]
METVDLSVVVPVSDGCFRTGDALAAAGRALEGISAEVIVVDGSRDGSGEAVPQGSPFRVIRAGGGANAAILRARGIAEAKGRIVALLEPWSLPTPDWARALLDEHEKSSADTVVGGPVVFDGPDGAVAWAEFFFEYGPFLPPFAGEVPELAVNNVSYRAELLHRVRPSWEKGFWKHFLHRELREKGVRFRAAPDAVVRHARPVPLNQFLRERIDHGRAYAARRGGSPARALIAPLLPIVLTYRLARRLREKPETQPALRRALPALVLAHGAWAWGEAQGHLAGDGGSSARVF